MIDDLRRDDLPLLGWSGRPLHITQVGKALDRVADGSVVYLVVRDDEGRPIAKGGVDFAHPHHPGAGAIWQLATRAELQSRGHGTALIAALEQRIRDRGLDRAELGVEVDNPRARALYERLGYVAFDCVSDGWDAEDENGDVYRHETEEILMRKLLD